jgi:hypothetical protein
MAEKETFNVKMVMRPSRGFYKNTEIKMTPYFAQGIKIKWGK